MVNDQNKASLETLRASADRLAPFDKSRALSLIAQHDRYALTPAQWRLVHVLARMASGGAPVTPRVRTPVGDLSRVIALFARAGDRLKAPAVVMGDGTGAEYRLKVARGRARFPGSLDVTKPDGSDWFGRIMLDGAFEASPRLATPAGLPAALVAFAADPATFAGQHARLTGRCMFCNAPIGAGADPRARAVGYGEVCAGHWGMPFPTKEAARASNAALLAGA